MTDWRNRAACLGTDPNVFFPHCRSDARTAIDICRTCPVQRSCREWANRFHIPYGVWAAHWRNPKVKWCPDCQQDLPVNAYTQGQPGGGGMRTYCRDCHNARTRQYRKVTA